MEEHDQGRSGLKEQTKLLFLNRKGREVSLERQTTARESQVAELRSVEVATTAKSTESPPDVKLDSAFASILKKKVYLLVDNENALSQSHRRIKHLEEQLQQKTDLLAKHANKFVDDFYFQCTADTTSKALLDALSKEEKARTQPGMETEFTLTEESVWDIIQAEVQCLSSQKGPQNSRGRSGRKGTQAPNDVNNSQRIGRSSSKGKNNHKRSQSTGRKPKRRGQSSNNNRRVSLPKNGGGRGTGHGT